MNADTFRGVVRIERRSSVVVDIAHGVDGDDIALTPETIFQTASLSKSFVAASVLALEKRGVIDPDDKVTSSLGDVPASWRGIRVRHLLAHTSGLPHFSDIDDFDLYRPWPRQQLIDRLAETPLRVQPGSGWHYSTPGYLLLAHVIEAVSQTPYATFLAENVLQPLELSTTAAQAPPSGLRAARGSLAEGPAPTLDPSLLFSHVWSNVRDLVRWPRALAASPLSRLRNGATAFDPIVRLDDGDGLTNLGYACGWFTGRLNGTRVIFHPGDQPGSSTLLIFVPEEEIVLAALAAESIDLSAMMFPVIADMLSSSRRS